MLLAVVSSVQQQLPEIALVQVTMVALMRFPFAV